MSQQEHLHDVPNGQTPSSSASARRDGEFTVPATPPPPPSSGNTHASSNVASSALKETDSVMHDSSDAAVPSPDNNAGLPQTIPNSQESNVASTSSKDSQAISTGGSDVNGKIHELSALAAVQEKADADASNSSRKRTADGTVKANGRTSPVKGHSRSISALSTTSTTGSHIGEMSADLKTRLAYAMVKVNNGWQTRSLQEVESLASHAASPTTSSSTIYRRQGSSASPKLPPTPPAQVHFAVDPITQHRQPNSPQATSSKPMLAPPAPIQPATSIPHSRTNSRRNHNPRQPPTLLTSSHSATAGSHQHQRSMHNGSGEPHSSSQPTRPTDGTLYSPHQNVREQDTIEALLFMSSPGNSANVKHAFSPSGSPGPQHDGNAAFGGRHALPSGPRRTLPGGRPGFPAKKVGFDKSPAMLPPHSPMELDSPHQTHQSPGKWTPKRRANGVSGHTRGALSLPSGIGIGGARTRQTLRDEDIERILDRAAADSSDDEEIQLPARVNAVTRPLGV